MSKRKREAGLVLTWKVIVSPARTLVREQYPSIHGHRYLVAGSMPVLSSIHSRVPGCSFSRRISSAEPRGSGCGRVPPARGPRSGSDAQQSGEQFAARQTRAHERRRGSWSVIGSCDLLPIRLQARTTDPSSASHDCSSVSASPSRGTHPTRLPRSPTQENLAPMIALAQRLGDDAACADRAGGRDRRRDHGRRAALSSCVPRRPAHGPVHTSQVQHG